MLKNTKKRAALHNLGCRVNSYETECMTALLKEDGYEIVPFSEEAEVYVINTCTVTQIADKKSRQMLRRARAKNPSAIIVATGCYVQTDPEKIIAECGVDIMIGNNEKSSLCQKIREFEQKNTRPDIPMPSEDFSGYNEMFLTDTSEHTRAFMKVQDGCNQFCSYCMIPYARGRVRSRKIANAVEEAKNLAQKGYKEVVLTGIHLGSFGYDSGERLIDLIKNVSEIEGIERVRFGSLEPMVMSEEFVKELSGIPEICPHFHLSLQSGSDTVLERMNRHYTADQFAESCDRLRFYFDRPAITTDIIAGFPGETDKEFNESLEFVKKTGFYQMHVFPYSVRPGTRAAKMGGQIKKSVKEERAGILIAESKKMSEIYENSLSGKTLSVLFEEESEEGILTGFCREYVRIYSGRSKDDIGKIITGSVNMSISGRLEM
ncbi:MAG: tRNA (N(6)-L-threonylcarbamoyladenosine(37)-C(2))-methylthiotransferase MtaB [Lachnospiraceae bacterium]|nr:tRNA (N(6)-L-threonylcarbamoyladenosine(37)-C(2))-methylthiotransferase MtaB [Lachnospiraceae bacterium]